MVCLLPRTGLLVLLLAPLCAVTRGDDAADFFESRIRPVLAEHCYSCHSAGSESVKGGLLLDTREATRKGGDSGPAVVPGKIADSLLISAIKYESYEMPPSGRLPDQVIADFEHWVQSGAEDPRDAAAIHSTESSSAADAAKDHWAFQLPQRHDAPATDSGNPIDGFIVARLSESGLQPAPRAEPAVLRRRLWLSVTGMLPPPAEQRASADHSESASPEGSQEDAGPRGSVNASRAAWHSAVEEALSSPHYGEHWARMWLDVMRFAEDQAHIVGDNKSLFYPNAWKYRDWVISSLNEDLAYDQFIRLQLAADLIAPDDPDGHVALGFIGLGPKYYRRGAPEVMADEWENQVDTLSRGLLGLTIACARCHDHKYDPIPTEEYYALAGVFAGTELFNRPLTDDAETQKNGHAKNPEEALHIVRDVKSPKDIPVHIRGNHENRGPMVPRGMPAVLTSAPVRFESGSGRLELAQSIAAADNPLTARVIVNRVWGKLFGTALVGTPSNFGLLGDRPTHPELLDDLSVRFMENGWSLKWLVREIVTSDTWQQTATVDESVVSTDPENRLLARMNRRRLSVEMWRDAVLQIAGRLEDSIGGQSVSPEQPESRRRTIYSHASRLELNSMLALFDYPDPNVHAGSRVRTTTPLQKMFLLNSPFMDAMAAAFAERCTSFSDSDDERIGFAFRTAFGREPDSEEQAMFRRFLSEQNGELSESERWILPAHVLLAANELQFTD